MTALLDANILIALTVSDHVHHDIVEEWYEDGAPAFATCPLTQGALLRFLLRCGSTAAEATEVLISLTTARRHEFWSDDLSYDRADLRGVVGHRQVTDAYLSALARARQGRLLTLDRGLAALHADVVDLLDLRT